MTPRQKALLLGSPAVCGLVVALGWWAVDRILSPIGARPDRRRPKGKGWDPLDLGTRVDGV